jgi:hypothetical protein
MKIYRYDLVIDFASLDILRQSLQLLMFFNTTTNDIELE